MDSVPLLCAAVLVAVSVGNVHGTSYPPQNNADVVTVPKDHTWTFTCNGNSKISIQSAKYVKDWNADADTDARPAKTKKSSCKRCSRASPPFCQDTCARAQVGTACQAKQKCTIKNNDPSKDVGCKGRPLKIQWSCVRNPPKAASTCS